MQSHEQSELRRYLYHTKECRDIARFATAIHQHYEKMYPGGILPNDRSQSGALQLLVQYTARYDGILRAKVAIRELQSRVSATVSSLAASLANTIMLRHQPASRPPRSRASSAMDVPAPPVPQMPPISIKCCISVHNALNVRCALHNVLCYHCYATA